MLAASSIHSSTATTAITVIIAYRSQRQSVYGSYARKASPVYVTGATYEGFLGGDSPQLHRRTEDPKLEKSYTIQQDRLAALFHIMPQRASSCWCCDLYLRKKLLPLQLCEMCLFESPEIPPGINFDLRFLLWGQRKHTSRS